MHHQFKVYSPVIKKKNTNIFYEASIIGKTIHKAYYYANLKINCPSAFYYRNRKS